MIISPYIFILLIFLVSLTNISLVVSSRKKYILQYHAPFLRFNLFFDFSEFIFQLSFFESAVEAIQVRLYH